MEFTTIKVQLGDSMAWINLDRPEVRNALNDAMISELTEAFDWLNSRDDIRVIILKGNGKDGSRCAWWEASASRANATNFCLVNSVGGAGHNVASHASICAPLCFRIG